MIFVNDIKGLLASGLRDDNDKILSGFIIPVVYICGCVRVCACACMHVQFLCVIDNPSLLCETLPVFSVNTNTCMCACLQCVLADTYAGEAASCTCVCIPSPPPKLLVFHVPLKTLFILHMFGQVADLEEMKPPAGIQGLQAWQSIKLSSSSLLASQSQAGVDRGSFRERLAQKRQLHSALIGDCPCIMTPVTPPPSVRSVMTWIQNKLTILEAKKGMSGGQTEPSTEVLGLSEVGNRLKISQKQENYTKKTREEDEREDSADTAMGREGLFTILKDKGTEPGSSKTFELAHISGHKASSQDIHVFLGSPEYSHLDATNLHSTLVEKSLEKTSQDELTPITSKPTGEQTESIEQEPEHTSCGQTKFVTPKRFPLRRLSTNTERVLRQNILASQAKVSRSSTLFSYLDLFP